MEDRAELMWRIGRFGVVGLVVMGVFMGLNALLGRWMGAQAAFLISYLPAVGLHFCLNKWWTFGCRRTDAGRQVAEYLGMVGVTFVVQWAVFTLVHGYFEVRPWLAAGVANAAQMGLSFFLMQIRIFGRHRAA